MNQSLLNVAIEEAPAIISLIKSAFAKKHPDEPEPTSAEVIAAWEGLYTETIARDEALLRDKPDPPIGPV